MSVLEYKLTDNQWFAFISGMVVGEWFNSSTDNIEYQTIFEPIGVGGTPTTGLKIDKIPYTGQTEATFSLTTHHVNIKYCGFNAILNIPSGLSFLGFTYGDFGENIYITEEDDKLYIQGFKENNEHITTESLLCLLKFKIIGTPTKDQPLTFQNGSCQDFNSSMLLQYMKGIYWGISPMKNEDGGLLVESSVSSGLAGPTITVPIGEESQTQLIEADTDFYTQSGFVCYQNESDSYDNYTQDASEIGIIANNNYSRNFCLNLGESTYESSEISHVDFNFYIYSELLSYEVLHDSLTGAPYKYYSETLKVPEWESCEPSLRYDYEEETLSLSLVPFRRVDGDLKEVSESVDVRHISFSAYDINDIGTYHIGCFNLSYTQHKYILNCPKSTYISEANDIIYGIARVYYKDGESEDILLSSRYIAISDNVYGVFIDDESSAVIETDRIIKEIEKDDGLGYTELEGNIYSDSEQDIEIVVGDIVYRVHLKPGWNSVKIKIPHISYKKQIIVVKIKVIVPDGGYILFPLGFTIKKKSAKDAVETQPWLSSLIDKFFIRDRLSYNKFSKEDVDLDFILENLCISEVFNFERVEIENLIINLLEYLNILDESDIGSGGVSVNLDALIEILSINEKFFNTQFSIESHKKDSSDGLNLSDTVILEFE